MRPGHEPATAGEAGQEVSAEIEGSYAEKAAESVESRLREHRLSISSPDEGTVSTFRFPAETEDRGSTFAGWGSPSCKNGEITVVSGEVEDCKVDADRDWIVEGPR